MTVDRCERGSELDFEKHSQEYPVLIPFTHLINNYQGHQIKEKIQLKCPCEGPKDDV